MRRNLLESMKTLILSNIIVFRLSGSFKAALRTSNQLVILFLSNAICMKPNCKLSPVFLFKTSKMDLGLKGFPSFYGSHILEAVWKMNKTHFHWERVSGNHRCGLESFHLDLFFFCKSLSKRQKPTVYSTHTKNIIILKQTLNTIMNILMIIVISMMILATCWWAVLHWILIRKTQTLRFSALAAKL